MAYSSLQSVTSMPPVYLNLQLCILMACRKFDNLCISYLLLAHKAAL